jgi:hypothetical protein
MKRLYTAKESVVCKFGNGRKDNSAEMGKE